MAMQAERLEQLHAQASVQFDVLNEEHQVKPCSCLCSGRCSHSLHALRHTPSLHQNCLGQSLYGHNAETNFNAEAPPWYNVLHNVTYHQRPNCVA